MGNTSAIDWPRFKQIVAENQRFLLTSHIRPDCDALGSELAMAGVLESLGKEVRIVNGQATPPTLAFIDAANRIQVIGQDVQIDDLSDVEVLMVLDTSSWAQLGPMGDVIRTTKAQKIILDHHISGDQLEAEEFRDTRAEATGHLVIQAADQLGVEITEAIATPAFAAIATDTGWFRFPSTGGGTYRVAGRLVDAGADPQAIFTALYEQETLARVQLRGRILARTKTELDGRLVHTAALPEDFEETGALPTDTEDVVNVTLEITGTEVAVIFVSLPEGGFKLSFRSRAGSSVDCSVVAKTFGGGGHRAAAGGRIEGPLDAAQSKVLDAVRSAMR